MSLTATHRAEAPDTPSVAALARSTLRHLASERMEPTPENYARAFAEQAAVSGLALPTANKDPDPKAVAASWAALLERVARNLDRSGKQWTPARRKDSLGRVLAGSRSDPSRLHQRLSALIAAWESDQAGDSPDTDQARLDSARESVSQLAEPQVPQVARGPDWRAAVAALQSTVVVALPRDEHSPAALADRISATAEALATDGAGATQVNTLLAQCAQARQWLGHRHRLVEQLSALCRDLTYGLTDLAEDDSWTRGQCEAIQSCLAGGSGPAATGSTAVTPSVRAVRAASDVLAQTRKRQQQLRTERLAARDALKHLIQGMLVEVGELGEQTGRFTSATAAHARTIAAADSIEDLADVVKSLLEDSRSVQAAVSLSQQRLQVDSEQAQKLESKVRELESELRRLSDEVCTDALTKVANRRGLAQAFEAETARSRRQGGSPLAVGLIDIDNFKKLNDSLGHAAGDVALKTLASEVQVRLRPVDHLARFGGEEFVVLLPGTELAEAQMALTHLQRNLTEALFLHEGREVFVTFSAGVTVWRDGELLDTALERADSGLYEAKHAGKNRTCTA